MILLNLLFIIIYMIFGVFCYTTELEEQLIVEENDGCDGPIEFWQNFYNKAKKEHPSASVQELTKFITEDILNDPNLDVIFVRGFMLREDIKYFDNSYYLFRDEFLGTPEEFISLPYNLYKEKRCTLKNNLTLGMLKRDDSSKNNTTIYDFLSKPISVNNAFMVEKLLKEANAISCPEHPKIQEIIEELERMQLSPQNWTHLCVDKLKNNFKTSYSGAAKAELNSSNSILSQVVEGEGTVKEMTFCMKNHGSPRCKQCHIKTQSEIILVNYMES